MWSETIGYREYLEPYLEPFFRRVAEVIPLTGREDLLDLGCGSGELALGFAPFVRTLTGLDLEQPMLEETAKNARAMGREIRLVHSDVEQAPTDLGQFHLITIGRAHWFMHTAACLARLERWLMTGGRIVLCRPVPDQAEWHRAYLAVRNKWNKGPHRELMKLSLDRFFQGTDFVLEKHVSVRGQGKLELEHLIFRALGVPATTPATLGPEETERMVAALRAALAPYFRNGPIMEQYTTAGLIYRRRGDP
jgi:SAM-dependent methyltransferase